MDDILTVAELALKLKLTDDAIYQMVSDEKVPFFRVGKKEGAIRFKWSNIEKWIAQKQGGI